jgi:flagellar protein FlbD
MISVHHGGKEQKAFSLNPDLIRTIETRPDTIIALTDGDQVWVRETPAELHGMIADWKADVLFRAMRKLNEDQTPDTDPS